MSFIMNPFQLPVLQSFFPTKVVVTKVKHNIQTANSHTHVNPKLKKSVPQTQKTGDRTTITY